MQIQLQEVLQRIMSKLAKLNLIADYIVETGSEGYWKWEKWANGKLELWNTAKITGTATASGSSTLGYDFLLTLSLPVTFVNIENVSGFAAPAGSWGTFSGWTMMGTQTLRINASGNSNTTTIGYSIRVIGTWK